MALEIDCVFESSDPKATSLEKCTHVYAQKKGLTFINSELYVYRCRKRYWCRIFTILEPKLDCFEDE
jgi:hypothetical protein